MAWAFFPYAWGLSRRAIRGAHSPLLAIGACMALVGIGYVHATIALGITLLCLIVEAHVVRVRAAIVRAWAAAVCAGLFAVIVHLPGLLVSPVTGRTGGVANDGSLTVDAGDLMSSNVPVAGPQLNFFGNQFPHAPLLYIAWFLPLVAFIDWRRFMAVLAQRVSAVAVFGVATLALLLLPSNFGPLRFPVRLVPYLVETTLLLLVVGLSLAPARATSRRFAFATGYVILSAGFAYQVSPESAKLIGATAIISFLALWVLYRRWATLSLVPWRRTAADDGRTRPPITGTLGAAVAILVTIVMIVPQHKAESASPLRDYGVGDIVSGYQSVLDGVKGDVFVVGSPTDGGPAAPSLWRETSVANLFYIAGASVQNAYSSVYYPGYNSAVCMQYNGFTCPDAYTNLFRVQPGTGKTLADLMGVSSVQVVKRTVPADVWKTMPKGWHLVSDTPETRVITRDKTIEGAGGVVWSSGGTKVTEVAHDAMGVTFRVDSVPSGGGQVALSRVPWPGYRASAGATVDSSPFDGFLTQVDLSPSSAGRTITVSYWCPGWPLELAAGFLLLLISASWVILRRVAAFRARRGRTPSAVDTIVGQPAEYERLL
jgi:hypothetical protein